MLRITGWEAEYAILFGQLGLVPDSHSMPYIVEWYWIMPALDAIAAAELYMDATGATLRMSEV